MVPSPRTAGPGGGKGTAARGPRKRSRSRSPRDGARHRRSGPKEEGGVRLSAAVRVHRTASHERSPLRGREADPGALATGRAASAPAPGEEEFLGTSLFLGRPGTFVLPAVMRVHAVASTPPRPGPPPGTRRIPGGPAP